MKRIKHIAVLLLVMSSAIFSSCNSDDSSAGIGGVSPSDRVKEAEKKLKSTLVASENGWIVEFFPNNTLMGGYRMWYGFNEDGTAQIRSDIDFDKTGIVNSRYNFVMLSTLGLSFPNGSVVHEFIKMNEMVNRTDIEFLIKDYVGENIVFKGHTTRNDIVFTKATAEDRVFDLTKNKQMSVIFDGPQTTLFKSIEIVENGNSQKYALDYTGGTRFGRVSSEDGTPFNDKGGLGFGYTSTGLVISPAIKVGDEEISRLDYNASTQEFVGTASSGSVIVKNLKSPLFTTDDYLKFATGSNSVGFIFQYLWGAPSNSSLFAKGVEDYYMRVSPNGVTGEILERIEIRFNGNNSAITYRFEKGKAPITHTVRLSKGNNGNLIFTNVSINGTLPAELQVIDDALVDPAGFYIKREDGFGAPPNAVYSIASGGSIKIKFATYLF